ncbi:Choloylglycine hydrolase [Deinococcus marmoris]|uniref:choloylglycine hydrolase n=2 Tax=Deinococcus marmoris TaxID=249408 RepID=A0A1U7P4L8_9DEIO|nr:Choloylglycine hydrolase [Deinococcus marmoris]
MDIERSFGEQVVITPRGYPLTFKREAAQTVKYAMIGMGSVAQDYPLYAEAVNERGLGVAGTYFPGFAKYATEEKEGHFNVAAYELIPWILSRYATVDEAYDDLTRLNLMALSLMDGLPVAELHWLVSDRKRSVVIEFTEAGLQLTEDPIGLLTNNPSAAWHLMNLRTYLGVTAEQPEETSWDGLPLTALGQGQGAYGLPGDASPPSRFVKAAFLKAHAAGAETEAERVSQFFHILDGVAMVRGTVALPNGGMDSTTYSSCMSIDEGLFYYKTYGNSRITAVDLNGEDLDGEKLIVYPLNQQQDILRQPQPRGKG